MECRLGIFSSGATHEDLSLILTIEVKEDLTGHKTFLYRFRAGQASFLVDRKQALDRAMLDIIGSQKRQLSGNTDTVVGAKGRAVRAQPFAIDNCLDRIVLKIMLCAVIFLANHIHVRLQDYGWPVLHTRSGGFGHDDITNLIFLDRYIMVLSE